MKSPRSCSYLRSAGLVSWGGEGFEPPHAEIGLGFHLPPWRRERAAPTPASSTRRPPAMPASSGASPRPCRSPDRRVTGRRGGSPDVSLYVFDLLEIDGRDLRKCSWESRREALTRVLRKAGPGIRLSEHMDGDGPAIFRHACAMGLEGGADAPIGSRSRTRTCRQQRASSNEGDCARVAKRFGS